MRTRLFGTIAIAALALTSCGGGDDGGSDGGGGGGAQDQVADMMIDVLNEASEIEGVDMTVDEGCIRDKAGQLSDADAQAIVDAGPEGDPEVSDAADAIADTMIECVDLGDFDLGELDSDG